MKVLAAAAVVIMVVGACASPSPGPTVRFDGWTADCSTVQVGDCEGVARLFVNNLAWNSRGVLDASGGRIAVEARSACPSSMPDWAESSSCWQASAAGPTGDVCMVVARQADPARAGSAFGQVGGDEMAGRAGGPPAGWPVCD